MAVEIYDNLDVKKASHLDERLVSVSTASSLPDPTVASNFIYEGAIAYVVDENAHYRCEDVSSVLTWVYWMGSGANDLVVGSMTILPTDTVLDLSAVTPSVDQCYAVEVSITDTGGGQTSAAISSITNFPSGTDRLLTFKVENGKQLTFVHNDYATATANEIVIEDGYDMTLTGRVIGNETLTLKAHGTAFAQWDAVQFVTASEWLTAISTGLVVDNLTTQDGASALSANQGYILAQMMDEKQQVLSAGDNITLIPGSNSTEIQADPWEWVSTIYGTTVTDLDSALIWLSTNPFGTSAQNYYRIVGRSERAAPTLMLPPRKDPTVLGNWRILSEGVSQVKHAYFKPGNQSLDADLVLSNQHFVTYHTSDYVGDWMSHSYDAGSPGTAAKAMILPNGLYEVKIHLVVLTTDLSDMCNLQASLWQVTGDASSSNPLGTGAFATVMSKGYGSYDARTSTGYQSFDLIGTFEVDSSDAANPFVGFTTSFAKSDGSTTNLSTYTVIENESSIQVTKIR